jgi:acyl-CoA hydrolase
VIVFVAMDANAKATPVPPLQMASDEDKRLAEYALKVMELSKGIEATIEHFRDPG